MLKGFVFVLRAVLPAALLTVAGAAANATVVTLGEQDFADGTTVALLDYNRAQSGESAPAGGRFRGRDVGPTNGNFNEGWVFDFAPETPTMASLTMGLYDHDCDGSACTVVDSFLIDGNDFTAALTAALRSTGTFVNQAYDVVTIDLSSIVGDFADGVLEMSLRMRGGGILNELWNGIGIDFARLTTDVTQLPEPETLALFGLGLAGLGLAARRHRRRPASAGDSGR